ncbi:pseudouridine-5'-phosphate glycosidase [Streptomyces klenkii]|uniref:pseudouridine-5'-phosphate glycosidase n=1 Tax=Streptomyces klenkii TaxID=1420899 RepID=UPI00342377A0
MSRPSPPFVRPHAKDPHMPRIQPAGLPLHLTQEVTDALNAGHPVVALESQALAHNLPASERMDAALRLEDAVRSGGAVPAMIAVEEGHLVVGMTQALTERLVSTPEIPRISGKDLPLALAQNGTGVTTLSACLLAAEAARIPFLVSADIATAHRRPGPEGEVSCDVLQLTRSRVAVVCPGTKSISPSVRYLQRHGVPVFSHGFDGFPSSSCSSRPTPIPYRLDDAMLVGRAIEAHWALGNRSCVLITTPVVKRDSGAGSDGRSEADDALRFAAKNGIRIDALTSYLVRLVQRPEEECSGADDVPALVSAAEVGGRLAATHAGNKQKSQTIE